MGSLIKINILVLFVISLCSIAINKEHPLKLSTCIITCSPQSNELNLNFHFFEDDFGEHLSKLNQSQIIFDKHTLEINDVIREYIFSKFEFFIDDKKQILHWENAYKNELVEYVEFTIPNCNCTSLKNISVKNTLMLDAFEKQSNLVRIDVKGDGNFKTLRFNQQDTFIKTELK